MAKCSCGVCETNNFIRQNFKNNHPLIKSLEQMCNSQEIITTNLGMLIRDAECQNSEYVTDNHLNALKHQFDSEILNANFMSNADLGLCNNKQAIIFSICNTTLKSLATDASKFIDSLLNLEMSPRLTYASDPNNFNLTKHACECASKITKALNEIAAPQLS